MVEEKKKQTCAVRITYSVSNNKLSYLCLKLQVVSSELGFWLRKYRPSSTDIISVNTRANALKKQNLL